MTSPVDPSARMPVVHRGTHRGPHGTRMWRLAVPSTHGAGDVRPMLVMLHGCLQDAEDIARGTRLDAIAESRGVLVLYPEQAVEANARRCWNWFDVAHQHRDAGEPALLAGLVRSVGDVYGADPARVHLAGVSAGAAMAALTAVAYPSQFASLTLASGVAWRAASSVTDALTVMQQGAGARCPTGAQLLQAMDDRARALPVLVVHGNRDQVVSFRNAHEVTEQFVAAHDLVLAERGAPPLVPTPLADVADNGYTVRETQWRDASGIPVVTLLRIDELGHAWSGGSATGSFADERGPDISARIGALVAA